MMLASSLKLLYGIQQSVQHSFVTINCHLRSPTGTEHQFGENVQLTSTSKPVKSG